MRLELPVYEYKTHLAGVYTRPMHLTSTVCCHLYHHPTCPFNSVLSHAQAGMRPHVRTKSHCVTKATGLIYLYSSELTKQNKCCFYTLQLLCERAAFLSASPAHTALCTPFLAHSCNRLARTRGYGCPRAPASETNRTSPRI